MSGITRTPIQPLLIIGSMYVILGFSIGINAYFIPFVQDAFQISTGMSYLIMTATFSAYVIFGVPSGKILKAYGYKSGISIAFSIIAGGFALIAYAAYIVNFLMFLIALFVIGIGQTLLTGAVNSYVTVIGPLESAASRISAMGIADKLALAGASLLLGFFLDLTDVKLDQAIIPFFVIAVLLLLLGMATQWAPLPEIKLEAHQDSNREVAKVWRIPRVVLGIVAIFFDVGVEIIALGSINDYAKVLGLSSPQHYVWLTTLGMVAGYLLGITLIPKIMSQRTALASCALFGTGLGVLIVVAPASYAIYGVALLGLANSLLWPTIFPLASANLGSLSKMAASVLVMGIIGGAVLPLVFGYFADRIGHQSAYVVVIPAYLYLLFFAQKGSKLNNYQYGKTL